MEVKRTGKPTQHERRDWKERKLENITLRREKIEQRSDGVRRQRFGNEYKESGPHEQKREGDESTLRKNNKKFVIELSIVISKGIPLLVQTNVLFRTIPHEPYFPPWNFRTQRRRFLLFVDSGDVISTSTSLDPYSLLSPLSPPSSLFHLTKFLCLKVTS